MNKWTKVSLKFIVETKLFSLTQTQSIVERNNVATWKRTTRIHKQIEQVNGKVFKVLESPVKWNAFFRECSLTDMLMNEFVWFGVVSKSHNSIAPEKKNWKWKTLFNNRSLQFQWKRFLTLFVNDFVRFLSAVWQLNQYFFCA